MSAASPHLSSLSTLSAVVVAIAVYGVGAALPNTTSPPIAIATAIAAAAFLLQRVLFIIELESPPGVNCSTITAFSYATMFILRSSILIAMYIRSAGAAGSWRSPSPASSRSSRTLTILAAINLTAAAAGTTSISILVYQAWTSPSIPDTCLQNLNMQASISSNLCFIYSLMVLSFTMCPPVFRAVKFADSIPGLQATRVHRQALALCRSTKILPFLICLILTILSATSSASNNTFVFLCSLIFSDFGQLALLVFPTVVVSAVGHASDTKLASHLRGRRSRAMSAFAQDAANVNEPAVARDTGPTYPPTASTPIHQHARENVGRAPASAPHIQSHAISLDRIHSPQPSQAYQLDMTTRVTSTQKFTTAKTLCSQPRFISDLEQNGGGVDNRLILDASHRQSVMPAILSKEFLKSGQLQQMCLVPAVDRVGIRCDS